MGADNTFGEVFFNSEKGLYKEMVKSLSLEVQLQQLEEKAKELIDLRKQFDEGVSLQAMMIFTANEFYERKMMSLKQ